MNASQLLASAREWHQSGELARAEAAYRQLLATEPDNAELWYLVGTVCQPQGKAAEALAAYEKAVAVKPGFAQAQNSLGIALAQHGRSREAEECFAAAVRANPDFAQAHNNLGNALKEQGRREEALVCYQEAVRLKPDFAEGHNNLGNLQREMGRFDDAVANCRQALRLKPDLADAHNNLGAAYSSLRRWEDAATSYRQAIVLRPTHAEAHSNLGNALRELGRLDEAIVSFRQALELKADFAEAHGGLAMALSQRGDLDDALASCEAALRLRPEMATAQLSKGFILSELGRRDEALRCCEKALELQPDMPDAHKNRSLIWLLEGKLTEGFAEYEWRWKCPELPERPFTQPLWDGSALDGKTILLHAEQGLGDTLHFVRYAPLVQKRGGRVVLVCQRPLMPLMRRCQGIASVVAQGDALPQFDLHAPLLSLPRIFGTTLDSIPANVPYLEADENLIESWAKVVGPLSGFKVGIAWQGSRTYRRDRSRSVPLTEFAPLASVPGIRLISLQKGHGSEQLSRVADRFEVLDLGNRLDEVNGAFMDTAAVMKNLDLVITSDTAIPHLAGALGVPVWVALPRVPDWRWLLERDDSPWYPSMRLFRQSGFGNWGDVFERIAEALAERVGVALPAKPIHIEIRPSELIDRIARLEAEREIQNDSFSSDKEDELKVLVEIAGRAVRSTPAIAELSCELRNIHLALRKTADQISGCRRENDYGPGFVELAKRAYDENEKRRQLMSRMDELLPPNQKATGVRRQASGANQ